MAFASADDVAARLGRSLSADEATQVEVLLEDVESLILARIPDFVAAVGSGSPDESVAVRVESWAVVRFMKNPDGKYQEAVAGGEYSFTRDASLSRGELYLSENDWNALQPSGSGYSESFEIVLGC